ncbi:hypothetical protein WAI453_003218 [Rhynchosporium graminicola]
MEIENIQPMSVVAGISPVLVVSRFIHCLPFASVSDQDQSDLRAHPCHPDPDPDLLNAGCWRISRRKVVAA